MIELHDYVQFYLVIILFFVLWFYVSILLDFGVFNTKTLPTHTIGRVYTHILARKIAHIGWLEVVWTIIPILILTAIAIPSFKLLYALDVVNSPLLTLRCIGNQWYWTYECEIVKPDFLEIMAKVRTKYFKTKPGFQNIETRPAVSVYSFMPDEVYHNYIENIYIRVTSINKQLRKDDFSFMPGYSRINKLHAPSAVYGPFLTVIPKENYVPYVNYSKTVPDFDDSWTNTVELLDADFDEIANDIDDVLNSYTKFSLVGKYFNLVKYFHTRYTETAESFAIDSYMLDVDDLQLGAFRLLEVDNYPQLPADAEIRLAVTGTDVIHSFAVPSLGVKIDAIPGRLNQFGIRVRSPGTYYGQCSELCGVGHGFMPIKVQFLKVIK